MLDLFNGVPGVQGAHIGVGVTQDVALVEHGVRTQGRQVLQRAGDGQGVLAAEAAAVFGEQQVVEPADHLVHRHALLAQQLVVLVVHHAVLGFLAVEVLDVLQQLGVVHLIAVVAHGHHEELLAGREDQGHGVEEAGAERVATEPVLRDALVEPEVQLLTGHDRVLLVGLRGHLSSSSVYPE